MSEDDWVRVSQYTNYLAALVVSGRLSAEGVPNRIWSPPRSAGKCYISVPEDSVDAAKQILAEPPVSETELTALALKDPPPDDFEIPREKQANPFSEPPRPRTIWVVPLLITGLLGALLVYVPRIESHEITRQRSPDGRTDAVLMEVPRDAADAHSYRVCLQGAGGIQPTAATCREVAYLAGVSSDGGSQPIALVWKASSQLEIRYANASSVHIYKPVFMWGDRSLPDTSRLPILVRAVQAGSPAGKPPPYAQ